MFRWKARPGPQRRTFVAIGFMQQMLFLLPNDKRQNSEGIMCSPLQKDFSFVGMCRKPN